MWKYIIIILIVLILILGLVGGGYWYSKTQVEKMPMVTPEGSGGLEVSMSVNPAPVSTVEVLILESDPVQVVANVTGELPDSCTSLNEPEVTQDETTFTVTINASRPSDLQCAQTVTEYEKTVQLTNTDDWDEDATYTVIVNGVEEEFSL